MCHCRGEKLSCPKAAPASPSCLQPVLPRPFPEHCSSQGHTHAGSLPAPGALLGPGSGSVLAAVGSGAVPRVLLALRGAVRGPLPMARAAPASPPQALCRGRLGTPETQLQPAAQGKFPELIFLLPPGTIIQSINRILKRRSLSWGGGAVFWYVRFCILKAEQQKWHLSS